MRELQRRITRLEQARTGGTPLVFVPMGSTPEEAKAEWLAAHPGECPGKIDVFISSIPEPDPLPEEFA